MNEKRYKLFAGKCLFDIAFTLFSLFFTSSWTLIILGLVLMCIDAIVDNIIH